MTGPHRLSGDAAELRAHWHRIEPLLDAAFDLRESERRAFLEHACAGDLELLAEVEHLLARAGTPHADFDAWVGERFPEALDDVVLPPALPPVLATRYRLEREIGRGGMAVVYLAHDLRLDRSVAVKVLRPEFAEGSGAQRFSAEIRLTANLRHPNIVPVFDSGEVNGWVFFVMSYVDGETARDRLERTGPVGVSDAVRIVRDVLAALAHAHAAGVVHRDIKPSNILLTGDAAVLADFGIARDMRYAAAKVTQSGTVMGTPAYMSPEQFIGADGVGPASDIYSVGCVLYELLNGEPPVSAAARLHLAATEGDPMTDLPARHPTIPAALLACVERAIAIEPAGRFPSAGEFARALSGASPAPARVTWRARPMRSAALLMIAVASGFGMWRVTRPPIPVDDRQVVIFPFDVSGAKRTDSAEASVRSGIIGTLKLTRFLQAVNWTDMLGAVRESMPVGMSAAEKRLLVRQSGSRYWIDGQMDRSDSLRVQAVVHDAVTDSAVPRLLVFPLGTSAWLVGSRVASVTVPVLMPVRTTTDVALLEQRAPSVQVHFLRGEEAYRSAHFAEARAWFERATREDSTFAMAWIRFSDAARWNGDDDAASHAIDMALRDSLMLPLRLRHLARGVRAYFDGRADEAIHTLRLAVAGDDRMTEAWMQIGEVYRHLLTSDAAPDSLSAVAFRHVRTIDRKFVPVLHHLVEIELREGHLDSAEALLQEMRTAQLDSSELIPREAALRCLRDPVVSHDILQWSYDALRDAALILTIGGLRQPQCALAYFQAAQRLAPANERYGILAALQGIQIARGDLPSADSILRADSTVNGPSKAWLYMIDALAGVGGVLAEGAATRAGDMERYVEGQPATTVSSFTWWKVGLWRAHRGDIPGARRALTALRRRVREDTTTGLQSQLSSLEARVALAERDTATAIRWLERIPSDGFGKAFEIWIPEFAPGLDRLLLAELQLATRQYARAGRTASFFDTCAATSLGVFLPRSLQIRIAAAKALNNDVAFRELTARLAALRRS